MCVVVFCLLCCFSIFCCVCGVGSVELDDLIFFFFKQKTAYEMRISDWSSDVCSSDLMHAGTILSMRRSLSLHARAQQGEARDAGKRRAAAKEMEDQSPFGDDLIARPSIQ